MIPLQLTVQGLYSYQQAQTIDFKKLTESQLFGIFGSVGSGKSSILEAIVFALYDRSERLNKSGDDRYYNMLNLQSKQLMIDFVFQVASPEVQKYRFTVRAQRKTKHYEKVALKERAYYRWESGEWMPLEVTDTASIVGMTYENFMQTVIIPQGKFREFIDRKPNDRTQMLKELFRLEKFDLGHKSNQLLAAVRSQITDLTARLSEIGLITPEAVDGTRQEAQELEMSLLQNKALFADAETASQSYERLRKLFADQEIAQEEWQSLMRQQLDYQVLEKQLLEYREAETYFNEKFRSLANTVREQSSIAEKYRQSQQQIETCRQRLATTKLEWESAEAAYADRETIREQCLDLEHLIRICQVRSAESEQLTQEENARLMFEKRTGELARTKQELGQVEKKLVALERTQDQQKILQEIAHWSKQKVEYTTELAEKKQQLLAQQRALRALDERKSRLLDEYQWPEEESFSDFFVQRDTHDAQLSEERQRVQNRLSALRARAELADRAQRLKAGEACPLCGATHHPSVAHSESLDKAIKKEAAALLRLQQREQRLNQLGRTMQSLHGDYQSVAGKLEEMQSQHHAMEAKLESHKAAFVWEAYRPTPSEEVMALAQQQQQQENEQKKLRALRAEAHRQREQQETFVAEAQQKWQDAQQTVASIRTQVDNYRSLLKILPYERYQTYTEAKLQHSLEKGQAKLQSLTQAYETARKSYQEGDKELSILEGKRDGEKVHLDSLTKRANALETEIITLCQEKNFDSPEYVKSLIDLKLDKEAVQEEIISYKNRLHAAEITVKRLQQETQNQRYDVLQHREAQTTCDRLKQEIGQLERAWGVAQREIKEQQEKLKKIQLLDKKLAAQRIREENLKEICGLFRGSGFVNYASTVLLEDVCRAANVRFKQLTRNNLSLELNQDNDFIVRDYLNDGKTRLLKTLSGGQTFQAALCLALALAENIKSLNQAQQSFFFLDEGFGALDKASLRIVFDTLKSLRQENRVVGIISHVEELQQEIDVYLKIENDKESGSLVTASWE